MSSTIHYERIFTNSEIQELEHQIKFLMGKQKEMKTHVKEEYKKLQLRLEKELMDSQNDGNEGLTKLLEHANDISLKQQKLADEEIDKDMLLLKEQIDHLANLRYEKDYWKELELKGVLGQNKQPTYDDFVIDCEKNFDLAREHFDKKMRHIFKGLDNEDFDIIVEYLNEMASLCKEGDLPIEPREPQKDGEEFGLRSCEYGTFVSLEERGTFTQMEDFDDATCYFTVEVIQPDESKYSNPLLAMSEERIALKTAHGKYISATEQGQLNEKETIGDEETWVLLYNDDDSVDKFAFKSCFGRYISVNNKGKVFQASQIKKNEWFWKTFPDMLPAIAKEIEEKRAEEERLRKLKEEEEG